jgi:hypothetical protein
MSHMTLQDAEQYAAQNGIALTPANRAQIAAAQRAEMERLQSLEGDSSQPAKAPGLVDKFNQFYPRFLESLHAASEVLLTLAQTVIVAFGIPATLVLLMIVEHQRVYHGIALFEVDTALASFAGAALVILNLVLEFQIHYVESRAGYVAERETRWSLRIWAANARYTLGINDGRARWQERHKSPATRYRRLLSLVTFSIVALALAGSMHSAIQQQTGAWHVALITIVTDSTLGEMMTWLGGLLFTAAAVLSAQGLSRYVALRCAEILAGMQTKPDASNSPSERYAPQLEAAAAQVVVALVNAKIAAKKPAQGESAPPAIVPFGFTPQDRDGLEFTLTTPNGNGHGTGVNGHNLTK